MKGPQHAARFPGFPPWFRFPVIFPQLQRQLPALGQPRTRAREKVPMPFSHVKVLSAAQTCSSWLFAGKGKDIYGAGSCWLSGKGGGPGASVRRLIWPGSCQLDPGENWNSATGLLHRCKSDLLY